MRRVHARIRGRVQGVSYRWSTAEEAHRLGIRGWVRNRPDGSVELWAEGDEGALNELIEWCRSGPPGARVTAVDTEWGEATGAKGFEIRR